MPMSAEQVVDQILIPQVRENNRQLNQNLIDAEIRKLANWHQRWDGWALEAITEPKPGTVILTYIDEDVFRKLYLEGAQDFSSGITHRVFHLEETPESTLSAPALNPILGAELSAGHWAVGYGDNVGIDAQVMIDGQQYVKRVHQDNPFAQVTVWYELAAAHEATTSTKKTTVRTRKTIAKKTVKGVA